MIHMVASIPRKRSEALVIIWQQSLTSHVLQLQEPALVTLVGGRTRMVWPGRGSGAGQACLQSCRLTSSVTWANQIIGFPEACVYLGTIRLCTRVFL